jgi:hypothetical protein
MLHGAVAAAAAPIMDGGNFIHTQASVDSGGATDSCAGPPSRDARGVQP